MYFFLLLSATTSELGKREKGYMKGQWIFIVENLEIGLVFSVPHRGYKIDKNALHSKWDAQEKRNEGKNRRGNIKSWIKKRDENDQLEMQRE